MRRTTLSLVLLLIVGLIPFGQGSLAVTQESEDKELRALLKSRREALKVIVANHGCGLIFGGERKIRLIVHISIIRRHRQRLGGHTIIIVVATSGMPMCYLRGLVAAQH